MIFDVGILRFTTSFCHYSRSPSTWDLKRSCMYLGFLEPRLSLLSSGIPRFSPPFCNYSSTRDLQFSSASQLKAATRKWGSWFKLREVEPSFKEFLASPARIRFQILRRFLLLPHNAFPSFKAFLAYATMMRLWLLSIKPDVGCKKSFPADYF
jgi:hypothetical protein